MSDATETKKSMARAAAMAKTWAARREFAANPVCCCGCGTKLRYEAGADAPGPCRPPASYRIRSKPGMLLRLRYEAGGRQGPGASAPVLSRPRRAAP